MCRTSMRCREQTALHRFYLSRRERPTGDREQSHPLWAAPLRDKKKAVPVTAKEETVMKKALVLGLSLSLALSLTACGAPKEEAPEDTNTPAVTEPADTSTPESEKETNFEEPPVPVIYDIANDSNKDGAISKEEWEDWVAKHPEDKNQNMDLTDDVVIETPTPEPTPNAGNNNSGGTTSGGGTSGGNNNSGGTSSGGGTTNSGGTSSGNNNSGGTTSGGGTSSGNNNSGGTTSGGGTSGNNNSGGTTSGGGTTTTPSTPDADTGNDVTPGNTDISDEDREAIKNMIEDSGGTWGGGDGITQEEIDKLEEQGGTYDPNTGIVVGGEEDGWLF